MNKPNLPKCLLGLFFCACLFYPATAQNHKIKNGSVTDTMTVLKILAIAKQDTVIRVIFLASERIYKLPVKAKSVYLKRLKWSLDKHIPVPVQRAREQSDVILSVGKAKKK